MVRFLFLVLLLATAQSNSFSESEMQDLLAVERMLIRNFQSYAQELQEKLRIIEGALAEYREGVNWATKNPELYLSNPVNAFRIIRHMSQDWAAWQLKMQAQLGAEQIKMQQRLLALTPEQSTLKRAAESLQFILKFYNYEPASLLQHNNSYMRLSPVDCYYMGVELYEQQKYHEAAEWLQVATENYSTTTHNEFMGVPHWRVYEMRSKVFLSLNMFPEANEALSYAIFRNPGNEYLLEQLQQLELLTGSKTRQPLPASAVILSELQQKCGGTARQDNSLSCELTTQVTPFLKLAPLRVEDLIYYPYMMIYKDGIFNREIEHIQKAFARCSSSNQFKESDGISGCLIPGSYSPVIQKLTDRMQDMAGLDSAMDGVFVLVYGSTNPFKPLQLPYLTGLVKLEDVEATAMLFINDVQLGGAVTIPDLDVVVYPRRGDGLLTFNEGNFEHTLCPNVVGTSMVLVQFMFKEGEVGESEEGEEVDEFDGLLSWSSVLDQ